MKELREFREELEAVVESDGRASVDSFTHRGVTHSRLNSDTSITVWTQSATTITGRCL